MPNIFEVELSDGRIVDVESDSEPTEDELLSSLSSWQEPAAPEFDLPSNFSDLGTPRSSEELAAQNLQLEQGLAKSFPGYTGEQEYLSAPEGLTRALSVSPQTMQNAGEVARAAGIARNLQQIRMQAAMSGKELPSISVDKVMADVAGQREVAPGTRAQLAAGIQNVGAGIAGSFADPINAAAMGTGMAIPALAPLVSGAFALHMGSTIGEQARAAGEVSVTGTPFEQALAYGNLGTTAAFVPGLGAHAVSPLIRPRAVTTTQPKGKQNETQAQIQTEQPQTSRAGEVQEPVGESGQKQPESRAEITPAQEQAIAARGGMESLEYKPDDLIRYNELKAEQGTLQTEGKIVSSETGEFTPEWSKNWTEFEALRNKYNGMPPQQVSAAPTPKAIREIANELEPAVMVNGKMHSGNKGHNALVREAAAKEGLDPNETILEFGVLAENPNTGFNYRGKFISRQEAAKILGEKEMLTPEAREALGLGETEGQGLNSERLFEIRKKLESSETEAASVNAQTQGEPVPPTGEPASISRGTSPAAAPEFARTEARVDPFERAIKGEEKAFDDLDAQFRETYPDPADLEARPSRDQVHTPQAFATKFNAAFAARDFDIILDTIKATSDVTIWKPFLQDLFKRQVKDPIAAEKAEWMRHVFNGTRPSSAIPRPPPKPSVPHRPPPPVTPSPRSKAGKPPPSPPPPPAPPAPPPVRIAVDPIAGGGGKSPYRIIEDFSASIGKAIRVLRMKKNGLGVYRPGSTLTAERFAGDLDTAAHELAGHWTDDKHGIGKPWVTPRTRSPYDSELAKFWIHGSVTPRSTLRYRRAEGIAEFIRAYVVNPKQAKLDAPTFAAYFEKTLPPDALKAINDFGADVRKWAGEDPLIRAGLNIRMTPPTVTERLWKGVQGRGFGFEVNPIDRLRLWFDDPYHYAAKAFHQMTELRGGALKPEQNFELLSRLLATHDSRMGDQFEFGLTPLRPNQKPNAKGQLEVERLIDPVTKEPMTMKWLLGAFDAADKAKLNQDMRDASAYMVAQRTLEKGAQLGKERVSGIGAGIMTDKQAAQELLNRVKADPAREARLKEAARRYRLWADQNLDMLVDSGRMSKESAKQIREDNQQYVDMHRLSEDFESSFRAQRGGGIGTTRDVIKRFKGSTLELDNVYSNLLEQTDAIQREAFRNVTMRTFTDSLTQTRELHGPNLKDFDQFGRKVTSADRNTISVFKDGRVEHWQFDPEIYDSLKGLGDLGTHAFIDLMALPSRFARYMITHGPQFIARNPVRDTFERSVTSRSGGKPWDILRGYSQAELSRYEVFGGGQFGNYIVDRHVWNRELAKTVREMTKDPRNIFLNPLKLKRAWESLAEKSEKLGRVAEFRRAFERGQKELGYDDYNAALYAAGEARGLLDFAKAGEVMKSINRLVPFSNARVRGLARAAFGFKENPSAFAMRWGMFVLLPTIATMLYNYQDEENWQEYQQLPDYQKDFFWNFKVGPYWLRIPKPHELGVMASGVERAIQRIMGDEKALQGVAGSAASAGLPVGSPVEGTGPLKTALELEFNRDTFRNRDIVPVWERDLKMELRKGTEHASGAGKGIASAINVTGLEIDPRQVDYVLGSYGGLGQIATAATGKSRGVENTILKGTGFVTDPAGTASRDVQWVIDWARKNGKLSDPRIKELQDLRKLVLEEKSAAGRDQKSARLRAYATRLRNSLDK